MLYNFEAKVMESDNGEWFIRLFRKDANSPSDGGEFAGLCGANGLHEAELIAECINGVIRYHADGTSPETALDLIERMFEEWPQSVKR